MDHISHVKLRTMKFLEDNIEKYLDDHGLGNSFFLIQQKWVPMKENNILDFVKIKNFTLNWKDSFEN